MTGIQAKMPTAMQVHRSQSDPCQGAPQTRLPIRCDARIMEPEANGDWNPCAKNGEHPPRAGGSTGVTAIVGTSDIPETRGSTKADRRGMSLRSAAPVCRGKAIQVVLGELLTHAHERHLRDRHRREERRHRRVETAGTEQRAELAHRLDERRTSIRVPIHSPIVEYEVSGGR